ncbi:MAG: hypothetical protein U1F40_00625 [Turneriella sp.]
MREQGFNPDEICTQVEASVSAEIDDARKFAEESPVEDVGDLLKDDYSKRSNGINMCPSKLQNYCLFTPPLDKGRASVLGRKPVGVGFIPCRRRGGVRDTP